MMCRVFRPIGVMAAHWLLGNHLSKVQVWFLEGASHNAHCDRPTDSCFQTFPRRQGPLKQCYKSDLFGKQFGKRKRVSVAVGQLGRWDPWKWVRDPWNSVRNHFWSKMSWGPFAIILTMFGRKKERKEKRKRERESSPWQTVFWTDPLKQGM